jgi:hypothetical protein
MPWPCLDATDSSSSFVVTLSIYQAERSFLTETQRETQGAICCLYRYSLRRANTAFLVGSRPAPQRLRKESASNRASGERLSTNSRALRLCCSALWGVWATCGS